MSRDDDEPKRRRPRWPLTTEVRVGKRTIVLTAHHGNGGIAVTVQPLEKPLDELERVQYVARRDIALAALMKQAGLTGYVLNDDPLEALWTGPIPTDSAG
jgi:hypothetical protein